MTRTREGPHPAPVLNFADIECAISEDRLFQPNLTCQSSPLRSSEEDEKIHHERTTEEFLEACEALMNDPEKSSPFSITSRDFDGNFILEALYDQGRAVERPWKRRPHF